MRLRLSLIVIAALAALAVAAFASPGGDLWRSHGTDAANTLAAFNEPN